LDDAYSVKAEEKHREDIQQNGEPKAKKQKSKMTRANQHRRETGDGDSGR
jgi:hypothetical protein